MTLIDLLDTETFDDVGVIPWSSPVPAFGDPMQSHVATVGLNPSNREFVDPAGKELGGPSRRFHTLTSLRLSSWGEVDVHHIREMVLYCHTYFERNPYNRWFRVLDRLLHGTGVSYFGDGGLCHLDLVPYATSCKWGHLAAPHRSALLQVGAIALSRLLRGSPIRVLILNGRSVVTYFENVFNVILSSEEMPSWSLPRKNGSVVPGFAYHGVVETLGETRLDHRIVVLGFNHNLQSSFGVTNGARDAIRCWIARGLGGASS
ncbi:MAG: hypothetical protein F4X67_08845 [Gemmatimonadales bacterium]|nr:hypothetical protein [Gemmatimonadales bacterium]